MSINVKNLTVGSHVEYEGKRMVVASVSNKLMNCENLILIDQSTLTLYKNVNGYGVKPIPITSELLSELGFINTSCTRRIVYTKGSEYEDSWIEFRNLKDRWEMFVSKDNWDGRAVCLYLHEAEAFFSLYNVELIKNEVCLTKSI